MVTGNQEHTHAYHTKKIDTRTWQHTENVGGHNVTITVKQDVYQSKCDCGDVGSEWTGPEYT
jgi:hypothetical protein